MNKTIEVIMNRTSVKAYSPKKVPLKKVMLIAEAAKMAPSAMNRQLENITILRRKSLINKISELGIRMFDRNCYYDASTLIFVHGPRDYKHTVADSSLIMGNMMIAASALKIGSCWINQSDEILSSKEGMKIKRKLGIPDEDYIVGTCVLGYPKEGTSWPVKARKEDFIKIIK